MATIPTITVTPGAAADAYARVNRGDASSGVSAFGSTLQRALEAVDDATRKHGVRSAPGAVFVRWPFDEAGL